MSKRSFATFSTVSYLYNVGISLFEVHDVIVHTFEVLWVFCLKDYYPTICLSIDDVYSKLDLKICLLKTTSFDL